MRCSLRSIGRTAVVAFLVLLPLTGALAEDVEFDNASAEGSQIEPAGADPSVPSAEKNLNSVPEDGESMRQMTMPDNPLVKKILASRPNEDLVICVAGCYTGQDRVVYAQPAVRLPRATIGPQSMLQSPAVINRAN
ncbi:MAG: hypothetical protein JSR99_05030 [Proteobacteria bacterium]|nr:hypothetical protein [Pseudomonadota bacterium]